MESAKEIRGRVLYGQNSNFGGTVISIKILAQFQLEILLEMEDVLSAPYPTVFRKSWLTETFLLLSVAGFCRYVIEDSWRELIGFET